MRIDRRLDQLILGLEVVVDVADGHLGRLRDIGDGGLFHATFVEDPNGGVHQTLPLPRLHRGL